MCPVQCVTYVSGRSPQVKWKVSAILPHQSNAPGFRKVIDYADLTQRRNVYSRIKNENGWQPERCSARVTVMFTLLV